MILYMFYHRQAISSGSKGGYTRMVTGIERLTSNWSTVSSNPIKALVVRMSKNVTLFA